MAHYYNIDNLLSRNKFFNFVIGVRGCGKTYGFKKFVINRALKYGEQFMYLRQNKNQIDEISDWVGEVGEVEFPDYEFEQKKSNGKILARKRGTNDEFKTIGFINAVSSYAKIKSGENYTKVGTIIFDEFTDPVRWSSRVSRVEAFLNIVDSVIRNRTKVRVLLMGNAQGIDNDFFHYFNIQPDPHKEWTQYDKRGILVNIVTDKAFVKERESTPFGDLIKDTNYGDFAMNNKYTDEDVSNIKPRSVGSEPFATIKKGNEAITIWREKGTSRRIFISRGESNVNTVITLNPEESATAQYYKYSKQLPVIKIMRAVQNGVLYFTDVSARTAGIDILTKLGIF